MKKIFIVIALVLCQVTAQASYKNVLDMDEAFGDSSSAVTVKRPSMDEVFPERDTYYSLKEFLAGFQPIVLESLWGDFKAGWGAIYEGYEASQKSDAPAKRLPSAKETEHIRCLYTSLLDLNCEGKGLVDMQRLFIYSRFTLTTHFSLIKSKAPDLAKRLIEVEAD